MALVYKAKQRSLERIVAVKILRPDLTSDPTAVVQFKLEANSVANLKHPNILMIHEAGSTEGVHYFIMEYVSAYSVSTWLQRKGRLTEGDALTVADAWRGPCSTPGRRRGWFTATSSRATSSSTRMAW